MWRLRAMNVLPIIAMLVVSSAQAQEAEPQPDAPQEQERDTPTMAQGQQLLQQQKWAEAAEVFRAITTDQPENGRAWHLLGYALHADGRLYEALPAHLMAAEMPGGGAVAMYNVACVYSLQEKTDKAFVWLQKARAAGFVNPQQLRTDPDMDNIRDDPRFQAILDSMTIPAPGSQLNATPFIDDPAEPPAPAELPAVRQLDFWVGEWDVFNPEGTKVGTNRITKDLNGNLILEHWTSASGGQGKSINYYDHAEKEWVQIWIDGRGGVISKRGGFEDGGMRMEGQHILPTGESRSFRSLLEPLDDGRIRQFIEESTDGGETWEAWFEGFYVRTTD